MMQPSTIPTPQHYPEQQQQQQASYQYPTTWNYHHQPQERRMSASSMPNTNRERKLSASSLPIAAPSTPSSHYYSPSYGQQHQQYYQQHQQYQPQSPNDVRVPMDLGAMMSNDIKPVPEPVVHKKTRRRWSLSYLTKSKQAATESDTQQQNPSRKGAAPSAPSQPGIDKEKMELIARIQREGAEAPLAAPSMVSASIPHGNDDSNVVHPQKHEMKKDRKAKMAGGATTGAIIGGVVTGPLWFVGAPMGAAIGSYATKVSSRSGERKQQQKWEQNRRNMFVSSGRAGVQWEGVSWA